MDVAHVRGEWILVTRKQGHNSGALSNFLQHRESRRQEGQRAHGTKFCKRPGLYAHHKHPCAWELSFSTSQMETKLQPKVFNLETFSALGNIPKSPWESLHFG